MRIRTRLAIGFLIVVAMILPATLLSGQELAEANRELERFNRLAVGREMRMVELKRENNELARQLGREPSYDLYSVAEDASEGGADDGA